MRRSGSLLCIEVTSRRLVTLTHRQRCRDCMRMMCSAVKRFAPASCAPLYRPILFAIGGHGLSSLVTLYARLRRTILSFSASMDNCWWTSTTLLILTKDWLSSLYQNGKRSVHCKVAVVASAILTSHSKIQLPRWTSSSNQDHVK